MSVLEQSRESMPAATLRTERMFLSACLVADWQQRDSLMLELAATDFHDPFHEWLFLTMRHNRRTNTNDLLAAIQTRHKNEPAPIGGRNIGAEVMGLVYDREGLPIAGLVSRIRRYAGDVKVAARIRAKQTDLEKQLVGLLMEAEEYERERDNDF